MAVYKNKIKQLNTSKNWTPQAIDCYKLDTNCFNCPIYNQYELYDCKMFEIVRILLEEQGPPPEYKVSGIRMEKECAKCKEIKPIEQFSYNKNSKDGHGSYCKECMSIINKKYQKKYKDRQK